MKIWSFTTVKDEEDIIESFVRYNMNILDGMVISDNNSNDNTLKILEKLKEEGYNIDIIIDKNKWFDQTKRRNELLEYTAKKYKPDYIFPIDADEFICTYKKGNPRKIIEKLAGSDLYRYKMENYILTGNESDELFIPKKMVTEREEVESERHNYKCIIPKKTYQAGIFLQMGSHNANYLDDKEITSSILDDLYLAHYPVRSSEQLTNKIIIGRLNNSSLHSREEGLGWHQYEILDEIIKDGKLSDKTLLDNSKYYGILNKESEVKAKENPINLAFCKNISIKYTTKADNNNILTNTIKTSFAIIDRMREELKEKDKYCEEQIKIVEKEKEGYKEELNRIINSKTWQLKTKIDKIFKRKGKKQ